MARSPVAVDVQLAVGLGPSPISSISWLLSRNGILVPSFLPDRTSPEAAALAIYRIVIKLYVGYVL
uniref:Uncharacterized protein n=1 Tax=Fagus sylvatica TaxID=28930 RepID=A0A2N9GY73_FAGSY